MRAKSYIAFEFDDIYRIVLYLCLQLNADERLGRMDVVRLLSVRTLCIVPVHIFKCISDVVSYFIKMEWAELSANVWVHFAHIHSLP